MRINSLHAYLLVLCGLSLALSASAQELSINAVDVSESDVAEVDVARDTVELRGDMADAIEHRIDVADTALVFNNTGRGSRRVICRAFNQNGRVIGRTATAVPANGLRYIRASDLAHGRDFVGSARCWTGANVVATAVFLAPGAITSLDVEQHTHPWKEHVRFPLVASY